MSCLLHAGPADLLVVSLSKLKNCGDKAVIVVTPRLWKSSPLGFISALSVLNLILRHIHSQKQSMLPCPYMFLFFNLLTYFIYIFTQMIFSHCKVLCNPGLDECRQQERVHNG